MAWAAVDRAVKAVEQFGLDGPVQDWKRLRREIFDEVCQRGFDTNRHTFTQCYGSAAVDASLLLLAPVGVLPATDSRIRGTVAAVERELLSDGFVRRYADAEAVDGLPPGEGVFLPCTLWLADNHILAGNTERGRDLLQQVLAVGSDLGLLAEEYDPGRRRLVGNFPQALSHLALVNAAAALGGTAG
jgi:GH15 family glucan-1,4-alpha-glucosidase